ncbi:MAG: hypothetical protein WD342_09715 [Verrucomicrobiales bacterium]
MKFKEIGTIATAGILSLAALLLLERKDADLATPPQNDTRDAIVEFEDDSTLVEFSVPDPTAEPADQKETDEEGGDEKETVLYESTGDADPIPITADASDDDLLRTVADEALPKLSELDETPDDSTAILAQTKVDLDTESDAAADYEDSFVDAVAEETAGTTLVPTAGAEVEVEDGQEPASIIEETPTGFWLREAKLNDVFQHLAQIADMQYFHNADLEGPSFVVTGQLMDDDPVRQMEELSLMYGVTIHEKGNTVYALTSPQLSQLPTEPFRYQLKYLRPSDIEQIKLILQPFLTPGSGIIEYESKTNTLIVMDNERKLNALALFLDQIDQPKQQIAIETRILRVTSSSANRIGVDWSGILGETGLQVGARSGLNALFNLPELDTVSKVLTSTGSGNSLAVVENNRQFELDTRRETIHDNSNLVLSPLELTAVLRALNAGNLAEQESSPTLIAEDNEEGLISIIDRIPIITSTITQTDAGQNITEEVRYKIDTEDPSGDPTTTREVGVSVAVIPTILPDDTIRMSLRPRSAQVVEYIEGATGNLYPRVNESTVTTTARVPNGHSLLIGGFYEEVSGEITNKVPLLGDIPAVKLLFKSTEKTKEHTSLVFIVTPKLYRPDVAIENDLVSHEIHDSHVLPTDHDYPDRDHPGHGYHSDLPNTGGNIFHKYEPDPPANLLNPGHPYNQPQARPVHGKTGDGVPDFHDPSVTVRSVNGERRKGGLLGKLFGGNKQNRGR